MSSNSANASSTLSAAAALISMWKSTLCVSIAIFASRNKLVCLRGAVLKFPISMRGKHLRCLLVPCFAGVGERPPARTRALGTALKLAWGGHDAYCVARNRVHPENVGLHKFLNGPRFRSAAGHQHDIRAKCPQFGGKDATIFGVDFDGAERLRIQCFPG